MRSTQNYNAYYAKLQANYALYYVHKIAIVLHYTTLQNVTIFDSYRTYVRMYVIRACNAATQGTKIIGLIIEVALLQGCGIHFSNVWDQATMYNEVAAK